MGLEDFEKELAEGKSRETKSRRHRRRDEDGEHKHRHRHHHRSHRSQDGSREGERRHRHKRHRVEEDTDERRYHKKPREDSPRPEGEVDEEIKVFDGGNEDEDEWVEKAANTAPPEEDILDQRDQNLKTEKLQRDSWMQAPSSLDIDYKQSSKPKAPPSQFVGVKDNNEFKVPQNQNLADLQRDFDSDGSEEAAVENEPAQHEVNYTFGDSGSSWRLTKLKAVYRQAEESGRSVDDIAVERYGSIRDFDDAREEEREMDRRKMYGPEYVGLEKPSGELFQDRKMQAGIRRESSSTKNVDVAHVADDLPQGKAIPDPSSVPAVKTMPLDSTALNKLKAQMMKAKLRNAPNAAQLEEEYKIAEAAALANNKQSDVIVLNNMESRMLASGRGSEVKAISGKRGRERGLVEENEDMSIEDMVRQEKRMGRGTVAGNEGRSLAERIAKDGKFVDDLDYMDDNAEKLSKKVIKSDTNLRNTAIGVFQQMQRILDSCPLCHHEDKADPLPTAPLVSLATRTYLTLPTEPEIVKGGAVIVPIQHRLNLLECDDDEWEEMRNFMKSLTRYYDVQGKGVIFYENAAHMHSRKGHAALNAIPLPQHLAENAPAYFKEAILAADEQWTQHKPVIDTQQGGKLAFRKSMVKEMPYFHVFFTLDGGMGHIVEDERRWPKGDLFAREIVGGMLDRGPEVVKKQGRWERHDRRVESFRKQWAQWDWTTVLMDAQ